MIRLTIFAAALCAVVAGCSEPGDSADASAAEDSIRVTIEDIVFHRLPDGDRVVTGTVVNGSDQAIAGAQVQLVLYRDDNTQVGTMLVPVQRIDPGSTQRFRSELDTDEDVRSVRARSIFLQ